MAYCVTHSGWKKTLQCSRLLKHVLFSKRGFSSGKMHHQANASTQMCLRNSCHPVNCLRIIILGVFHIGILWVLYLKIIRITPVVGCIDFGCIHRSGTDRTIVNRIIFHFQDAYTPVSVVVEPTTSPQILKGCGFPNTLSSFALLIAVLMGETESQISFNLHFSERCCIFLFFTKFFEWGGDWENKLGMEGDQRIRRN